ncbi:DinB family protein [Serinicoccus kebangsaanensis]|uniref:DinB family protein n=1 Tax=Serinicoccus kebangsaanensis TaxID=2602069 RepID=UPI00124CB373|nr:DinB family protein [Serinicoccus kebangsaanensis]
MEDPKETLQRYFRAGHAGLLWKLDGLSEYDARRPLTSTGTSLLGLVTHLAWVESGYFGECFGRPFPEPEPWDWDDPATDPNVDLVPDPTASMPEILAFAQRAWDWADETVTATDLGTTGTVSWWPEDRRHPTLHTVLVHVLTDVTRHAGHADILREGLDGRVGMREENLNLDPGYHWPAHVARVQEAADRFR